MTTTWGRVSGSIGAVFFLVFGLWAFFAPDSFFDRVATWPPYNEHLLHDIGAFQLGLGAALLAAVRGLRVGLVALGGSAVAAVMHVVSHAMDQGSGGRSTDLITLGLFAALLIAGSIAEARRSS